MLVHTLNARLAQGLGRDSKVGSKHSKPPISTRHLAFQQPRCWLLSITFNAQSQLASAKHSGSGRHWGLLGHRWHSGLGQFGGVNLCRGRASTKAQSVQCRIIELQMFAGNKCIASSNKCLTSSNKKLQS